MNSLAEELNTVLSPTIAGQLLSRFGREIFFPKGIVAQAAEAGKRAKRINATIGMAVEHSKPMMLRAVKHLVPDLGEDEIAAYSPTGGLQELRNLWLEQLKAKNPGLDSSHCTLPMVVPGLTNGIAQCADLFVDEQDTVLVPDMHWDNYDLIFSTKKNASLKTFKLFDDTGGFNLEGLDIALSDTNDRQKAILILNFPNNPSGYTPKTSEVQRITQLLCKHADAGLKLLVICDDAYFGLFYEKETCKESIFTYLAQAHANILAIKVDGTTKEDFSWGFRLGFITMASKGLEQVQLDCMQKKLMGSIRASVSNSNTLGQNLLLKAFKDANYRSEKNEAFAKLEARYRKVKDILSQEHLIPECLQTQPFNSGYFMTFKCLGISAEALRLNLLEQGIGSINFNDQYLRIAYAAADLDQLETLYSLIFSSAQGLAKQS